MFDAGTHGPARSLCVSWLGKTSFVMYESYYILVDVDLRLMSQSYGSPARKKAPTTSGYTKSTMSAAVDVRVRKVSLETHKLHYSFCIFNQMNV